MKLLAAFTAGVSLLAMTVPGAQSQGPRVFPKHVLAWADVRNGYQHESITHALSTIERLGWQSGLYDTIIRTDSQSITKSPVLFKQGTGIASGEQFLARNLQYFDAIFFFGVREIDLTPEQRADLLSFVRDDGKGFVATHAGATAFFSWPEFGEMLGGRFDEHPWGISEATVIVEDRESPITRHLPASFAVTDEHYQIKDYSRKNLHVLARLDPAKLDLKAPLVHRTDGDFAVAWTKTYGKGRVFYSTLGHPRELWDEPWLQTMYFEAIKWTLRQ
jgi:type 1 glutamine amidotransferase